MGVNQSTTQDYDDDDAPTGYMRAFRRERERREVIPGVYLDGFNNYDLYERGNVALRMDGNAWSHMSCEEFIKLLRFANFSLYRYCESEFQRIYKQPKRFGWSLRDDVDYPRIMAIDANDKDRMAKCLAPRDRLGEPKPGFVACEEAANIIIHDIFTRAAMFKINAPGPLVLEYMAAMKLMPFVKGPAHVWLAEKEVRVVYQFYDAEDLSMSEKAQHCIIAEATEDDDYTFKVTAPPQIEFEPTLVIGTAYCQLNESEKAPELPKEQKFKAVMRILPTTVRAREIFENDMKYVGTMWGTMARGDIAMFDTKVNLKPMAQLFTGKAKPATEYPGVPVSVDMYKTKQDETKQTQFVDDTNYEVAQECLDLYHSLRKCELVTRVENVLIKAKKLRDDHLTEWHSSRDVAIAKADEINDHLESNRKYDVKSDVYSLTAGHMAKREQMLAEYSALEQKTAALKSRFEQTDKLYRDLYSKISLGLTYQYQLHEFASRMEYDLRSYGPSVTREKGIAYVNKEFEQLCEKLNVDLPAVEQQLMDYMGSVNGANLGQA